MSLQGPELWSFIWQPWGTKTPQFLFWKLPGLTTSVWSVATVSSSVERSRLRPAGGALPTLTGGFWNGGIEQRRRAKCSSEGPSKCVSSATDPQDAVSLCADSSVPCRWASGHLCYCDQWYREGN